jgi:hypothetical protein
LEEQALAAPHFFVIGQAGCGMEAILKSLLSFLAPYSEALEID